MKKIFWCTILHVVFFLSTGLAQTGSVAPLGPSGGITTAISGTPDQKILLVGIRDRGIMRSADLGKTWVLTSLQFNDGLKNRIVHQILFSPVQGVVYAATDWGLFKSTDAGINWVGPKYSQSVSSVAINPRHPEQMWIGDNVGIKQSTDGGESWVKSGNAGELGFSVSSIAVDASNSTDAAVIIFAGTKGGGVYNSTNSGNAWEPFNAGLDAPSSKIVQSLFLYSLRENIAMVIGTANIPYLYIKGVTNGKWIGLNSQNTAPSGIITGISVIAIPNGDTSCIVTFRGYEHDGMPKSTRGGMKKIRLSSLNLALFTPKWEQLSLPNDFFDVDGLFNPNNQNNIFIASSDGVFSTTDGGETWERRNNGINYSIVRIIAHNARRKLVYAGINGAGVFRSGDDGKSWEIMANKGLENPYVSSIASDPNTDFYLYAGNVLNVYKSTDAGNHWWAITSSVPRDTMYFNNEDQTTLRISPSNSKVLFASSRSMGFIRSTDEGQRWTKVNLPVGVGNLLLADNFDFDPTEDSTLYYSERGIWKSTDLGLTWADISANIGSELIAKSLHCINPSINPVNSNEIYLPALDTALNPVALYRTINGGQSWSQISSDVKIHDLSVDPSDPGCLFGLNTSSVYYSSDSARTWRKFEDISAAMPRRYSTLSPDPINPNVQFIASDQGVVRVENNLLPRAKVDTVVTDFGPVSVGKESTIVLRISNKEGKRSLLVKFDALSDTASFHYHGEKVYRIPAGADAAFAVTFAPKEKGIKNCVVTLFSSDPLLPLISFIASGNGITESLFDPGDFVFGPRFINTDTSVGIAIHNGQRIKPLVLKLQLFTDSVNFSLSLPPNKTVTISAGAADTLLTLRFKPVSPGMKGGMLFFTTNDPIVPIMKYELRGVGVPRNLFTKKILFDAKHGFGPGNDTITVQTFFSGLINAFEKTGMAVVFNQQTFSPSGYSAVFLPNPKKMYLPEEIDSLQEYVNNGGTLVVGGNDSRDSSILVLNLLLADSLQKKWNIDPGVRLHGDMLSDAMLDTVSQRWKFLNGRGWQKYSFMKGIDSLLFIGSSQIVMTSAVAETICYVSSKGLRSSDTSKTIASAILATATRVGKGKLILIGDIDLWSSQGLNGAPSGLSAQKNLQLALNLFGTTDNVEMRLPEPTPKEEYRLISVPLELNDSTISKVFKDLGPIDPLVWRLFGHWSEDLGRYLEFPSEGFTTINRGEAYWLITRGEKKLSLGESTFPAVLDTFAITLKPGWNLIGNPYPYRVSWKNSLRDSAERLLWKFTGKEFIAESLFLDKFVGYFVKNLAKNPRTIKISPIEVTVTAFKMQPCLLDQKEWMIKVGAQSGKSQDNENYLGMLKSAADEYDPNDFGEPPSSPSGFVSLSFINRNWKINPGRYAGDFRHVADEGAYWDFSVASDKQKARIDLIFRQSGSLPSDFKTYVLDQFTERIYEIPADGGYSFTTETNESMRSFRFIAGTSEFLEKNTNGIPIVPLDYALEQNFPNPFNPATDIRYTLGHSGNVTLEIYTVLGQKVKTLVQEFQPIGHYNVRWDSKNDEQKYVSSGIYFYQLRTDKFNTVKRMILLK